MEGVFIFPFIVLGRLVAFLNPLKKEFETFFFFPFYHTGGAEKVHALITQSVGNKNCIIYFTRKSVDATFYNSFIISSCAIKNISAYTDNKCIFFMNLIYRGIISGYINKQTKSPTVFNGQSNFGYKISPWIKRNIKQVELIHSFNTFSWIRIPFIPFMFKTIMISKVRIEDHLKQYDRLKIPNHFKQNIIYICNGIDLPKDVLKKNLSENLEILYVGRGTEEKRVNLVAMIAKKAFEAGLPVDFTFMGDVKESIPTNLLTYCNCIGTITNENEIVNIYQRSHILFITSYTEGFPMVIMEAMAYGCVIIATPVGDIPFHVTQNENGFLFTSVKDESVIVEEGLRFLSQLNQERKKLLEISENNVHYAKENFNITKFKEAYENVLK